MRNRPPAPRRGPTHAPLARRRPSATRAGVAAGLSLALALLAGACGGEAPAEESSSTSETARTLLSSLPQEADTAGRRQLPPDPNTSPPPSVDVDVNLLGFDLGDTSAVVRVVEMSDYGCGYCRQFHMETWPTLREDFVEEGKVQWKFLPFITGMFGNSMPATEGAECALAQGREPFQRLNARLWEDQREWKGASDAHPVVRGMAEDAGVDLEEWDACMADDRRMQRIRAATALARDLGVRGTPTFFLRGYPPLQGALPTETFTQLLQMVHAQLIREGAGPAAGAAPPPGGDGPGGR